MAPASPAMNPSGLGARGGDGTGPGPLPFSVESLLEAQHRLGPEPAAPREEERPRVAAESGARCPPAARPSSPRKCPVARSRAERGPAWGSSKEQGGRALWLLTWESNQPLAAPP